MRFGLVVFTALLSIWILPKQVWMVSVFLSCFNYRGRCVWTKLWCPCITLWRVLFCCLIYWVKLTCYNKAVSFKRAVKPLHHESVISSLIWKSGFASVIVQLEVNSSDSSDCTMSSKKIGLLWTSGTTLMDVLIKLYKMLRSAVCWVMLTHHECKEKYSFFSLKCHVSCWLHPLLIDFIWFSLWYFFIFKLIPAYLYLNGDLGNCM